MESQQRLVVVSNRLPVTVRRHGDGWKVHASAGGLVTAMKPILDRTNGIWIGWPGDSSGIGDSRRQEAINHWAQREEYVIVDIPQKTADLFYEGYCNQTIWPLFHYFPSLLSYEPKGWTAYVDVNKRFCDAVVRHSRPGDLIWVHDYQLMLLPHLLREAMPDARIGFFLHIPFPSSELFRLLPARTCWPSRRTLTCSTSAPPCSESAAWKPRSTVSKSGGGPSGSRRCRSASPRTSSGAC